MAHPNPPSLSSNGRILAVDGLRGVAVLLVLLHHFVELQLPREIGSWQAYLAAALGLSFSGVDLFFVISGYLIGGILIDHRDAPNFYQVFYVRRTLRILPLYYLFLLVCWLLAALAPGIKHPEYPLGSYLTLLCNFWMIHAWDAAFPALAWSLAVEEQFYIGFPFLIRFFTPANLFRLTVGSLLAAPLLRTAIFLAVPGFSLGTHVLTICRMDSLAFGVTIALAMRHSATRTWLFAHPRVPAVVATACLPAIGYLTLARAAVPSLAMAAFGYTSLGLFYAAVLLAILHRRPRWLEQICETRALVFVGGISYFVYLFQGIVGWAVFRAAGHDDIALASAQDGALIALTILAIFILGAMSSRFFESKLISFGRRLRYLPGAAAFPPEVAHPLSGSVVQNRIS